MNSKSFFDRRGCQVRSALVLLVSGFCSLVWGQVENNVCDPGEEPDVIVGDLDELERHGTLGGITAYSLGTVSCNIGTCWLNWDQFSNNHPVIGQNMFRLKNGRFEQIGQSWLKHGFFALSDNLCFPDCIDTDGEHLGVHCSDPYSSSLNGQQPNLGPKSDVNATSGFFNYPFPTQGQAGDVLYKRLQVANTDLNPVANAGASYVVEGMYVALDDAIAGNQHNNASWRRVTVSGVDPVFNLTLTGTTQRQQPAIRAWQTLDPSVVITEVTNDGKYVIGAKASDLGNGFWHYEYAVQNLNSHRSGGSFTVPLPLGANVTNAGFHDVNYHSGEPWSGADWTVEGGGPLDGFIKWSTEPPTVNLTANAIRWATLYNFRFDADVPPSSTGSVMLGLWRVSVPITLTSATVAPTTCDADGLCDLGESCTTCPSDCNNQAGAGGCCGDGTCNAGENACRCAADCGPAPNVEFQCSDGGDGDCDGLADCADSDCCATASCNGPDLDGDGFELCDCDDNDDQIWARPGEVENLQLGKSGGTSTLNWVAPLEPGTTVVTYESVRSTNAISFMGGGTVCLPDGDSTDTVVVDATIPAVNTLFHYLVRATNACGDGSVGRGWQNTPIAARSCP